MIMMMMMMMMTMTTTMVMMDLIVSKRTPDSVLKSHIMWDLMHFTCPKLTRNFFFNSIMRDISTLSHINLRNICYLHQLFKCYRFLDILCHILSCQVTRILIQCEYNFKVCQSVHHHTFQINQPTRCKNFSSLLFDVYVKLNMFRASSRPSSGAQQLQ